VKGVSRVGKRVRGALYVHMDALGLLEEPQRTAALDAAELVADHAWNVARLGPGPVVALLHYPDFDLEAFPRLSRSARVDLATGRVRRSDQTRTENPLILHRKELLLDPADPRRLGWAATTERLERLGLFRDTKRIGRRRAWNEMLASVGLDGEGNPT
jgi:hypothetical protein